MKRVDPGRILADAFDGYREQVMDPTAGTTQVRECQYAFMAGAWTVLAMLERVGQDDFPEEKGAAIITHMHEEARAFCKAVSGLDPTDTTGTDGPPRT